MKGKDIKAGNAQTKLLVFSYNNKDSSKSNKNLEPMQVLLLKPFETNSAIREVRPVISKVQNNNNNIVKKAVQTITLAANKQNNSLKNVQLRILEPQTLNNLKIYQKNESTMLNKIKICEKDLTSDNKGFSNLKICHNSTGLITLKNVKKCEINEVSKLKISGDCSSVSNHQKKCIILNKPKAKLQQLALVKIGEVENNLLTKEIKNMVVQKPTVQLKLSKISNRSLQKVNAESTLKEENKQQVFPVAIQKSDQFNFWCNELADDNETQILGI